MSDLVTWLRAQIDRDERLAWDATEPFLLGDRTGMAGLHPQIRMYIQQWVPARIHAEVAAKRAIMDAAFQHAAKIDSEWGDCHDADQIAAGLCPETSIDKIPILRLLAQPYANRPGYREEWKP